MTTLMFKCNFCTMCSPEGECLYTTQIMREKYCKKAIRRMMEALQSKQNIEIHEYTKKF